MKKFLMMAIVALTFIGGAFARTFVIDIADSKNGKVISIAKNPYAPNYQCELPVDVTDYFKGIKLQPGDKIEVHYNFTSTADIDWINVVVVDNSEAAKYWLEISEYKGIASIKNGATVNGVIEYTVKKTPVKNIVVMFQSDKPVDAKFTVNKSGVKTGSVK